jgi:hypothetical protein
MSVGLLIKYPSFLSYLNKTWVFSADFGKKIFKYKFHGNPYGQSRVESCGRTDMTKLIVASRNIALKWMCKSCDMLHCVFCETFRSFRRIIMLLSARIRSLRKRFGGDVGFNSHPVDRPLRLLDSQVERIISLRNVGKYPLKGTASNPQTLESSTSPLWEDQNWQFWKCSSWNRVLGCGLDSSGSGLSAIVFCQNVFF